MAVRVAINGFGRIGRLVLRAILESRRNDLEVVGINDLGSPETNGHLLKYDSVHGNLDMAISVDGDNMDAGTGPIKVTAERDPARLPWRELNVDVAMECTGLFTKRDDAAKHLAAMGSGEAKKFRAMYGSAGRHGDSWWAEEKDNVGMKLLRGMGWSDGQGLGKGGGAATAAIKAIRKQDNRGVGAVAATRDEAFRASQDLFNDVLSRLTNLLAALRHRRAAAAGHEARGARERERDR